MMTPDQAQSLLDAMAAAGLSPRHPSKMLDKLSDAKVVRYELDAGKKGNSNGAICVYANADRPAGWFWSWSDQIKHSWTSFDHKQLTSAEKQALREQQAHANRLREEEQQKIWAEVAEKALRLWERGVPAKLAGDKTHPYLLKKGVRPFGLKTLRQSLMIPARNTAGTLTTLQFIQPDGTKKFLTGGEIVGSYFAIGKPYQVLLICEGYATGASLHQATGHAVAVAFNAGNLLPVAKALRGKLPDIKIIICADNDAQTKGNPGISKGREAAAAVGGLLVWPEFGECAA